MKTNSYLAEPNWALNWTIQSRRAFLAYAGFAMAWSQARAQLPGKAPTPDEVLKELMVGNSRFVSGKTQAPRRAPADFSRLAAGQSPEAVIIGCADSRVPPEILFDQGVGDLFIIRIAGNVVTGGGAAVKGSVAYAVVELGCALIMVLGHSGCGAVKAALQHKGGPLPQSIVDLVALVQTNSQTDLDRAIAANVRAGVARMKEFDPSISKLISAGRVKVVGAVYDLKSGQVTVVA